MSGLQNAGANADRWPPSVQLTVLPAQPRNGALNYGPLKAKIEVARGLLTANQLLITEVMRSIQGLRQQCQVFKTPVE